MMSHEDSNETLDLADAYVAMYYFIDAYWKRGKRLDGSVALLLHAVGPSRINEDRTEVETADPACWNDWLAAVAIARENGLPSEL